MYFYFIQLGLHLSTNPNVWYYVAEIWYDLTRSNDNDIKEPNGYVKLAKTTTHTHTGMEWRYSKIKLYSIYTRTHTHSLTIVWKILLENYWIHWNWLAWIELSFFKLNTQNENYVCIHYIIQQTKLFIRLDGNATHTSTHIHRERESEKMKKRNRATITNGMLNGFWFEKKSKSHTISVSISANVYFYPQ